MRNDRTNFIQQLFHFLTEKEYIWLKAVHTNPMHVPNSSDIDLLVREKEVAEIMDFVNGQPGIACNYMEEGPSAFYLHLFFADGGFLKLDLLTQLVRKQWNYLSNEYLFANRVWKNGIATCSTEVLLEHVVLFNFLNHSGLPKKYIGYFSSLPEMEMELLLSFINGKHGTAFESLDDMASFTAKARRAIISSLRKNKENILAERIDRGLDFLRSKIKTWQNARGKAVTFSGVDGAGKTTLLNDLRLALSEKLGQRVVVLRHRPGLLPILSAWTKGKAAAEHEAATKLPRQGTNNSKMGSLVRFAYYYMDYFVGQVYVWARYLLPGYTVIYDRYYFDFIIDGKRSNIALGEAFPKRLFRFVFKPKLNVFLYAPAEVIRERKQELPLADIREMTARYRRLFGELTGSHKGTFLCLENLDRRASHHAILRHFLENEMEGKRKENEVKGQLRPVISN